MKDSERIARLQEELRSERQRASEILRWKPHAFVARDGERYLIIDAVEYAQSGRSHVVIAESGDEHRAWEIARALHASEQQFTA